MMMKAQQMLALLMLLMNSCEGVVITEGNAEFASDSCKALVCEQAHEQAKGLSKLALLDEFVSQTVFLLNDLMKNIDGELEKSANSLLRYIHPECKPTQELLEEVIQKQKAKVTRVPKELGEGIKPMGGDEDSNYDDYTEKDDVDSGAYDRNERGRENRGQAKRDEPLEYDSTSSRVFPSDHDDGSYHTVGATPPVSKFGRGWKKERGGTGGWNYSSPKNRESPWMGIPSGQQEKNRGSRYGKKLILEGGGSKEGKSCKGVDRSSAFWVKGLDQWCQENCSKGYCPKTHCIC